ncbi:MAG: hypothetical protein Q8K60_05285, partial [Parachlamydiaceae bacterium]|nr:hypothetical protein [Parachlamydiaceae bacterium]
DENGHIILGQNAFLDSFIHFMKKIIPAGMLNSLSQVMIKLTAPGVPDIYQGNESWNFSLVDPDNRREVDYSYLLKLLEECEKITSKEDLESMIEYPEDGKIKFYLTKKCLEVRQESYSLFSKGTYHPLEIIGGKSKYVVGFARIFENQIILSLSGRFFSSMLTENGSAVKVLAHRWQNTMVKLPLESPCISFRNRLTNEIIECVEREGEQFLDLEKVFSILPMALLEGMIL